MAARQYRQGKGEKVLFAKEGGEGGNHERNQTSQNAGWKSPPKKKPSWSEKEGRKKNQKTIQEDKRKNVLTQPDISVKDEEFGKKRRKKTGSGATHDRSNGGENKSEKSSLMTNIVKRRERKSKTKKPGRRQGQKLGLPRPKNGKPICQKEIQGIRRVLADRTTPKRRFEKLEESGINRKNP